MGKTHRNTPHHSTLCVCLDLHQPFICLFVQTLIFVILPLSFSHSLFYLSTICPPSDPPFHLTCVFLSSVPFDKAPSLLFSSHKSPIEHPRYRLILNRPSYILSCHYILSYNVISSYMLYHYIIPLYHIIVLYHTTLNRHDLRRQNEARKRDVRPRRQDSVMECD